ncbi:LPS export ABC transporter periplasmic protein LptC [Cognataquiflexum rubidum]|uniref:LPS export ABC transporter periplasmic protein LptC n=1 Tax=Cognataquiflexum rubidum TaxID=2922273 RepID=UPI001F12C462|nr:LPS export ABC transporter periplasmic protein LptC [Cognataquiflexum rubidum]
MLDRRDRYIGDKGLILPKYKHKRQSEKAAFFYVLDDLPIFLIFVAMSFIGGFKYLILFLLLGVFSCGEEVDSSILETYKGPVGLAFDVELFHSDSTIIRTHVKAKKQMEFATGDLEFPEGIDISFFDKEGNTITTMRADKGFFDRTKNIYRGEGDVRVHNTEKDQKLSSEELFWDPNAKKIYTEKFVTIQEKETIFNGTGMESDDKFSEYKLFKVTNSRTILPGEGI